MTQKERKTSVLSKKPEEKSRVGERETEVKQQINLIEAQLVQKKKELAQIRASQVTEKVEQKREEAGGMAAAIAEGIVQAVKISMKQKKDEEEEFGLTQDQKFGRAKAKEILEKGDLQKKFPFFKN